MGSVTNPSANDGQLGLLLQLQLHRDCQQIAAANDGAIAVQIRAALPANCRQIAAAIRPVINTKY